MYIFINSKNKAILQNIKNLLIQQSFNITEEIDSLRVLKLELLQKKNKLLISNSSKFTSIIKIPFHKSEIINIIALFQDKYYEKIGLIKFYPFKGHIEHNLKIKRLSTIQNNILEIIVRNKNGILKNDLYKLIWPNDKNIYENKLDTHLTNLKSSIKTLTKKSLKIKTIKKIISIDIN